MELLHGSAKGLTSAKPSTHMEQQALVWPHQGEFSRET